MWCVKKEEVQNVVWPTIQLHGRQMHIGSTMLDLLKCVEIILQEWRPCLYAVLEMRYYGCLVNGCDCISCLVADGSSELC